MTHVADDADDLRERLIRRLHENAAAQHLPVREVPPGEGLVDHQHAAAVKAIAAVERPSLETGMPIAAK